jgi:drug/metabolite transporter (DMT)-like permease
MTSSWMLVAGALFALMGALAKLLSDQFSGAELAMYRSLGGLVAIGAFVLWRRESPRTRYWQSHLWRGATGTISLIAYFYAMTKLPLATAITLNYTSPIWLTALSALLLKERFNPRLLFSILLGFVGVAMLLRPTFASDQATAGLIGLASGFFAACAYVNVKKLGDAGEPPWRVVFYFSLVGMLGSALAQPLDGPFHPVNAGNIWPLLGVGLVATLAQLAMTRAYHSGNTLVVGAFAYSTVIFAAIFGQVFFAELLPLLAWLGMLVIIVSGLLAKLAGGGAINPPDDKMPALPAEED